jgi:hypothetical protein
MSPYEYYFRRAGINMSWVTTDAPDLPDAPAVWVILSHHTSSEQSDMLLLWEPKWKIAQHRAYTMTNVYLLVAR